jgi:L-malate glycosyltransferase
MPKTKVLYILPWLRTGGSERYVANLCRNLDRERFETVVLYRGEWGPIGDELKAAGIRTVRNPMKVYRPDQLFGFYRLLRKEGVDIVHSLNFRPNFTDALLTKWAGRKFVSSRRNLRFWKGSDRLHWGERLRNDRTDLVIANADRLKESAVSFEKLPADKVLVIYNGVPLPQAEAAKASEGWKEVRTELDIPLGALVIGNMANLRPTKGQTYLLQAFQTVLRSSTGPVYLVITGQGPEEENLQKMIKELGLEQRACIYKTSRDRFEVIRSFDIFVLSSLQEGFSNALVEAMALGLPCVATDVGGNAEAVQHNITGLIVPPKEPDPLAQALLALVEDPERRRIMGQTGEVRAHQEFDLERMVQEHVQAYDRLVPERRQDGP